MRSENAHTERPNAAAWRASNREAEAKAQLIEEQARRTAAEAKRIEAEARRTEAERAGREFDTLRGKVYLAIVVAFCLAAFVRFLLDPGSMAVGGISLVTLLGWLAKHAGVT